MHTPKMTEWFLCHLSNKFCYIRLCNSELKTNLSPQLLYWHIDTFISSCLKHELDHYYK